MKYICILLFVFYSSNLFSDGNSTIEIHYFYSHGCESCEEFINSEIPKIEKETNSRIILKKYDILNGENYSKCSNFLEKLGDDIMEFPIIVVGENVLQGDSNIKKDLCSVLKQTYVSGSKDTIKRLNLAVIPIFLAGLIDGINPCAFTTLLFLISTLALLGKTRKELIIIGLSYTSAIFICYFLIGLGIFNTLRVSTIYFPISQIIKYLLFAVLIILSVVSFYDFYLIKSNRADKILLQLPKYFKDKIHKNIRKYRKMKGLMLSSFALGFIISLFELACTGQVYFPTIAYMLQVTNVKKGLQLLTIYNIGFILPILIVFGMIITGISSKKIAGIFTKHLPQTKILLAVTFIIFAVLTII